MGFFKRISDIISANLNELTEEFEDPERMLRQAVREMEQSIHEVTEQTAKAMASEKTLARELQRNRQQQEHWQERAEKAVASGDDELARKALVRRREHEKLVTALDDQLESARETSASLRRQLDGMKAKLAEAKRSLATLAARQRAAHFRKTMESGASEVATDVDDNAFAKFERLRCRVEQAEAEAEAMAELRGTATPARAPEEEFSRDELDVSAELAELKRKVQR